MESKYKERAEILFESKFEEYEKQLSYYSAYDEKNFIIDIMCQFAKEVEKPKFNFPSNKDIWVWWETQKFQKEPGKQEYIMLYEIDLPKILKAFINKFEIPNTYTKEQVEELLEKQRKLCAKKAKPEFHDNCGASSQHPQLKLEKRYIHKAIVDVDIDSILNAKLKID